MIKENDDFSLKTQFGAKVGYVVWKRYNQWKCDYQEQYDLYDKSLKAIYSSLLEPYFIIKSLALEDMLERTMRLTVHESTQVIPSVIESINIDDTRSIIKENYPIKHSFNVPILNSYKIIDATHRLMLLERLFRNSTMIFKKDSAERKWHDLYRMIYATDSLFAKKAKEQNNQYLYINFDKKLKLLDLYTDYGFMSHILFNLVDNAIKYGVRGSNIFIEVTRVENEYWWQQRHNKNDKIKEGDKIKELRLSVINFGNEIKEKDRDKIFDLYYRSQGAMGIEGMGMGLFLVQKLCHAIGYTIQCTSVLMEKINLPYYYHFKQINPDYSNKVLNKEIVKKLDATIDVKKINEVVNKDIDKWRIPLLELEKNLDISIYKNEFVITIPVNVNSITLK